MEIHFIVVALVYAGSGHLNCKNNLRSRRSPRECTSKLGGILTLMIALHLTNVQCWESFENKFWQPGNHLRILDQQEDLREGGGDPRRRVSHPIHTHTINVEQRMRWRLPGQPHLDWPAMWVGLLGAVVLFQPWGKKNLVWNKKVVKMTRPN